MSDSTTTTVSVAYTFDYPGNLRECEEDDVDMIATLTINVSGVTVEFVPGELQSINWSALADAAAALTTHRERVDVSNYDGEIAVAGDTTAFNSSSWSGGHTLRVRVPTTACAAVFRDLAIRCAEFTADPIGCATKYAQ